jgi:arylsulfatase
VARRPDIVLFMTDQQRFDQVGYASGGHFVTPNLDRMAARGVIFENAYSASTVCVPARVALLTGMQPHRVPTQENQFALREGVWTIARHLRDAGYQTALIGKMHFAPVHSEHGFETMRLCEHLRAQGSGALSFERDDLTDDYHDWLVTHGFDDWRDLEPGPFPYSPDVHPTGWIERETLSLLERRDPTRPLFLVVSFPHPHAPYNPPEPYASMFDPADSHLPREGYEVNDALPGVFQWAIAMPDSRDEAASERGMRVFLATVRGLVKQIDDAMGSILDQLRLEESVVFFTSDHGDYAGHRGLVRKLPWLPFDDLARVPLVVAAPGADRGRRRSELVQNCDFALTCLDYAGVDAPPLDFDSCSLRRLIEGEPTPLDQSRAVFCATSLDAPMVRRGPYKYVRHSDTGEHMLFDLDADPMESVNRVDDPGFASIRAELVGRLRDHLERPRLLPPAAHDSELP